MPISAPRDANRVPTALATLDRDGITVVAVQTNPTNHAWKVDDNTTGASKPFVNAQRDANRIPAMWGVSSADGVTPIPVYCDSNGTLLIKSV